MELALVKISQQRANMQIPLGQGLILVQGPNPPQGLLQLGVGDPVGQRRIGSKKCSQVIANLGACAHLWGKNDPHCIAPAIAPS